MDTQNLKQRPIAGETTTATDGVDEVTTKEPPRRNRRITKRGLSSLLASAALPVGLMLLTVHLWSSNSYAKTTSSKTPLWFPPAWAVHVTSAASAFLMGLAAWLVWAKGGFHASPNALYLYLAQLGLGVAWDPLVFGAGMNRIGLVLCLGMLGSLVGCYQAFKGVNPLAGEVMKPCLAWTAFLALVNLTLVCI